MLETVIKCDGCRSQLSGKFIEVGTMSRVFPANYELRPEMWSRSSVGVATQRPHQFCGFLCLSRWAMKCHEVATETALITVLPS
jgi:hypothetical protein